jgi:hypothetical protein
LGQYVEGEVWYVFSDYRFETGLVVYIFNCEPKAGLLTVRMPSPVHGLFKALLANGRRDQLKQVTSRRDAAGGRIEDRVSSRDLLEEGISGGGTEFPGHAVQRETNGQFQHEDAAYPAVVLEIPHSQGRDDLRKLTSNYILGSNGDIIAGISIDINYDLRMDDLLITESL